MKVDRTDESASHFCAVCGAWWLLSSDGTWQLRSQSVGENCCNNQPMHGNRSIVSARHAVEAAANILRIGSAKVDQEKRERVKELLKILQSIANRLEDEGGYVYTMSEGAPHLRINEAIALLKEGWGL